MKCKLRAHKAVNLPSLHFTVHTSRYCREISLTSARDFVNLFSRAYRHQNLTLLLIDSGLSEKIRYYGLGNLEAIFFFFFVVLRFICRTSEQES